MPRSVGGYPLWERNSRRRFKTFRIVTRNCAGGPFNICRFDRGLCYTHVPSETADANLAEPALIFPVSHWNDMNIVIVESPAKAKTINKYLGSTYEVLASFGHVRDLPAKNG